MDHADLDDMDDEDAPVREGTIQIRLCLIFLRSTPDVDVPHLVAAKPTMMLNPSGLAGTCRAALEVYSR